MLIIGIDGGASKTTCAITNETCKIIGIGTAGPSNYQIVGVKKAKTNLLASIREAKKQTRVQIPIFDVGCFCMGGLDTKRDFRVISHFVKSLSVAKEYIIVNDVLAAFYALTQGKPGVVVVAGTGAIAHGVNKGGQETRSSGWGWLIGDEGSAFYIAKEAFVSAAKAYDGRGPTTILMKLIKNRLKLKDFADIIPIFSKGEVVIQHVASLAPLVELAAEEGDQAAIRILDEAGKELSAAAVAVARKLKMKKEKVIVGGDWRCI